MKRMVFLLFILPVIYAQPWTGVLAPARAIDWRNAGSVPGSPATLPDAAWTQSGSAIAPYGSVVTPGNTSTIQGVLNSCAGGHYVLLASGTFYLTGSALTVPSNCELKGSGANSTIINYSGSGSGCNNNRGSGCFVALQGSNNYVNGEQNHATWTAGFTQGAISITVSNSTNITANSTVLTLDQLNETADTGNIWNCVLSACGAIGSSGAARTDNTCSGGYCSQEQHVLVTACSPSCNSASSTTLTISPGLYMPNWASAKGTGAWWATTTQQQAGVRDISINMTSSTVTGAGILINNCYECFVFQVALNAAQDDFIDMEYSAHSTVMSNYIYNSVSTGTGVYAVEIWDSSDNLILNNICQRTVECWVNNGGGEGNVIADNFAIYSLFNLSSNLLAAAVFDHTAGDAFTLLEGDFSPSVQLDDTHGTHNFFTEFRSAIPGWASNCSGGGCTNQTWPNYIYGGARYTNLFANIWGQAGYHNALYAAASASSCNGTTTTELVVGCGAGVVGTSFCNNASCSAASSANDLYASTTLAFYDNYDTYTGSTCTSTSGLCVVNLANGFQDTTGNPSSYVALASPGAMPPSFIFAAAPTFFGNIPFPAIGPDVSGGNLGICSGGTYSGNYATAGVQCTGGSLITSFAGHANANPAMNCFLNVMGGTPDGSGSVLNFSPSSCYSGGGTSTGGGTASAGTTKALEHLQ